MAKIYRAYYYFPLEDNKYDLMYTETFSNFKQALKDVEKIMSQYKKSSIKENKDETNGTYEVTFKANDARGFKLQKKIEIIPEEGEIQEIKPIPDEEVEPPKEEVKQKLDGKKKIKKESAEPIEEKRGSKGNKFKKSKK